MITLNAGERFAPLPAPAAREGIGRAFGPAEEVSGRTISYERELPALDGERSKPYLHRMGMRALSRWGHGSRRALLWAALAGVASFGLVAGSGKAPAGLASSQEEGTQDPLAALMDLGGADDQVVLMATRDANNECCIIRRVRVGQATGRRPAAPLPKRF